MKYVVTGGAGFIGSHVTAALLERGHDVVAVDNLFSGRRESLDEVRHGLGAGAGTLEFVRGDVLDRELVVESLRGAAAVFHQAAIASVPRSFAEPASALRVNIEGTATLLEGCREAGVSRFVMASSSSVYGDTPSLPKHEEMELAPLSPYALSKKVDEDLLAMWHGVHALETVALRYFNVFGPRQDPTSDYAAVVPKFITRMLAGERPIVYGDGRQSRDFTFVDNAVAANLLAGGVDSGADGDSRYRFRAGGTVMNIGVGERYTLLELIDTLNDILGTDLQPEFHAPRMGDVMHSLAAIDRARELIGYEPAVGLREGLERTVSWYRERAADASSTAAARVG